eukprot:1204035-Rhodomonas_salina.2
MAGALTSRLSATSRTSGGVSAQGSGFCPELKMLNRTLCPNGADIMRLFTPEHRSETAVRFCDCLDEIELEKPARQASWRMAVSPACPTRSGAASELHPLTHRRHGPRTRHGCLRRHHCRPKPSPPRQEPRGMMHPTLS